MHFMHWSQCMHFHALKSMHAFPCIEKNYYCVVKSLWNRLVIKIWFWNSENIKYCMERCLFLPILNSNAVAERMAREYWKMHAQASSCIADTALSPRNAFNPMQNSAPPRPALDRMHYSGFVQYRQCSSRPSRAFSNTPFAIRSAIPQCRLKNEM